MFIPFLFNLDNNLKHTYWMYAKFVDFCLKNELPMVVSKKFYDYKCNDENNFIYFETVENYNTNLKFDLNSLKNKNKIEYVFFTQDEERKILGNFSINEMMSNLIKKRNKIFEEILDKKIQFLLKKYKNLKAFITWLYYPSLNYVLNKYGIKLINFEFSSIRRNNYNTNLCYLTFESKYSYDKVKKEFPKFNPHFLFSREELLLLFSTSDNLSLLKKLNSNTIYDFGLDYGNPTSYYNIPFATLTNEEILNKLDKLTYPKKISIRKHPAAEVYNISNKYTIDNSNNSVEWILKCKRIVTMASNIGFEAQLYGRPTYVLTDKIPFYFDSIHDLNSTEDYVSSIKLINYFIFAYFVPYDFLFNVDYLSWRISNNNINDIYKKNYSYILKQYDISEDFTKLNEIDRKKILLRKVHGFSDTKVNDFLSNINRSYDDLEQEICDCKTKLKEKEIENSCNKNKLNQLEFKITNLNSELYLIKSSKGWKALENIRRIKNRFKN